MKCTLCPELAKSRVCQGELYCTTPTDNPQVMAIAEAPGIEENRVGRPLIGVSGQEGRHHLTINGIVGRGVWLTNVVLCHPPNNRDPSAQEIRNCVIAHLIPTILRLQPKYILTFGRIATQVIQDIQEGKY